MIGLDIGVEDPKNLVRECCPLGSVILLLLILGTVAMGAMLGTGAMGAMAKLVLY